MITNFTYPGVYIEETAAVDHQVADATTSVTAFVGRAHMGSTDGPVTINSFGDFQSQFGPLDRNYPMSYAVRDFFANGPANPSQAVIVRLWEAPSTNKKGYSKASVNGKAPSLTLEGSKSEPRTAPKDPKADGKKPAAGTQKQASPSLQLQAANPGTWGDQLQVYADQNGIDQGGKLSPMLSTNPIGNTLFNLTVIYKPANGAQVMEYHQGVSTDPNAGDVRLDLVLRKSSRLIRVEKMPTAAMVPAIAAAGDPPTITAFAGGSDSADLTAESIVGNEATKTGIYALKGYNFNLLCLPPDKLPSETSTGDLPQGFNYSEVAKFVQEEHAFLILDAPSSWEQDAQGGNWDNILPTTFGINDDSGAYAAVYFPRVQMPDPNMGGNLETFPTCGIVAGVMARTDAERGVWKAPAGVEAGMDGVTGLTIKVTDQDNGTLNVLGINCLRQFPVYGPIVWGARTLRGANLLESPYKYVNVRRLTNFIELSLQQSLKWAVFEPNDGTLWNQLEAETNQFMTGLKKDGAVYDFKVACDSSTNSPQDIEKGIVNVVVAFAPVKPAEFVVVKIQQQAGVGAGS